MIVDELLRLAARQPDAPALAVLGDGERESERATYGALTARVRELAGRLQAVGLAGKPVVVALPAGLDFAVAVLACMFAGAWATPMPEPPRRRASPRWDAILGRLRPAAVIAAEPVEGEALHVAPRAPAGAAWTPPPADPGATAFIQFTSGSTASPKGVVVSHGALDANRAMIRDAFGHRSEWRTVTWLPPYHDMGLVGGLLQPLGAGSLAVVLPPLSVVQRPLRWLKAISDYRGAASGGPSFGFQACVDRIAEGGADGLDLSCWRVAYCGAEPVRAATLQAFAGRFASAGFDPQALYPCYGLAEATLFATGPRSGEGLTTLGVDRGALREGGAAAPPSGEVSARTLAGCGRSWGDARVWIRDPATGEALGERRIGEVMVQGDHLASGYYDDPEATAQTFTAQGLRTGDLGFLDGGQLFPTGRLKDVVIVRGVKHHAEDLEAIAERAHPALALGAAVSFSIDDGGCEQVVLAQELQRGRVADADLAEVRAAIGERLLAEAGLRPDRILLLRPGAIPRTSSGKVQRSRCRDALLSGAWPAGAELSGRPGLAGGADATPRLAAPAGVELDPSGQTISESRG